MCRCGVEALVVCKGVEAAEVPFTKWRTLPGWLAGCLADWLVGWLTAWFGCGGGKGVAGCR